MTTDLLEDLALEFLASNSQPPKTKHNLRYVLRVHRRGMSGFSDIECRDCQHMSKLMQRLATNHQDRIRAITALKFTQDALGKFWGKELKYWFSDC